MSTGNHPKVSVCVPSYNCARYLPNCINSVLDQTFVDWELIVVDDCSRDNSADIVRAVHDPRIRPYENDRNLGLVRNVNSCLSRAHGEYICVLHSDDALLPAMLEESVAFLDQHPEAGYVQAAYFEMDEHGNRGVMHRRWQKTALVPGPEMVENLLLDNFVGIPTVLMRRSCYESVGPYDESYEWVHDWEMWIRAATRFDVGYLASCLAHYRVHTASVTQRKYLRQPRTATEEEIRLINAVCKTYPLRDCDITTMHQKACSRVYSRHAGRAYSLLCLGETRMFRSELAYALEANRRILARYPGLAALWALSLLGPGPATSLLSMRHGRLRGTARPGQAEQ